MNRMRGIRFFLSRVPARFFPVAIEFISYTYRAKGNVNTKKVPRPAPPSEKAFYLYLQFTSRKISKFHITPNVPSTILK